ncbi:MAG: tetraacyldisaccharide 4'-kinase [Paludibacteraceae bacterium]|nr:tetraacyldisaccharide 4'-kinase [Paludibacteraceae bacterium]
MKRNTEKILRIITYPVGWIYALVSYVRNELFDMGVLKSKSYKTAIISVGNITVGGTGKTPFVEYIIGLLKNKYRITALSRGYGRRRKGFIEASSDSGADTIGDEPYQILRKYPDIRVAVDANRCRALDLLEAKYPDTDAFILDDAFQHRYVSAGKSILLIDYNRPINKDSIIPYGNLRESAIGRYRADIVVITKCPNNVTPLEARDMKKELKLKAYQNLYFSTIRYGALRRMSDNDTFDLSKEYDVLLVTAIANSNPLCEYLGSICHRLSELKYEDHHTYKTSDLCKISKAFDGIVSSKKIIVTTSKDESKLLQLNIPEEIASALYVVDITVDFLFDKKNDFDKDIIGYVEKNKRNSVLFTK